jgi:hypothetical protein
VGREVVEKVGDCPAIDTTIEPLKSLFHNACVHPRRLVEMVPMILVLPNYQEGDLIKY